MLIFFCDMQLDSLRHQSLLFPAPGGTIRKLRAWDSPGCEKSHSPKLCARAGRNRSARFGKVKDVRGMSMEEQSQGEAENAALLKRIAALESELESFRRGSEGRLPLPAREALLDEAERVAHLGTWILNLRTEEVKWSRELFHILGYDPDKDAASTERFFQALHPADLPMIRAKMSALADYGALTPVDLRVVWKDGTVREIRTGGVTLRGPDGTVDMAVGTVLDVTDARKVERQRKMLENQLRQAQKMEVVGRVAGGVAHDFNNLLTIISGNADLLLESGKDDKVQRIRDAAEVGAALTRQLLAFSRQAVIRPEAVDLNAAVRDIVRIMGRLLGEDIQIRMELLRGAAFILADRGQVQQVLLNLAVNSRDAMPNGGRLAFTTRLMEEDPGLLGGPPLHWVELQVQDQGSGMDDATRERAFEPFFTTKEPGKGTGLGLSTVKDIVLQAGGNIALKSKPGKGTTVTLRFPPHLVSASPAEAPGVTVAGSCRSILLVEDNSDLRELVAAFLVTGGYRVQSVGRPGEAETIFKSDPGAFDLLVADMVMPEKSGRDLAQALLELKPELKVLFISGYAPNRAAVGDSGFLQKPFTRNELLAAVAAHCNR